MADVTEQSMIIVKRGGRPRARVPRTTLCVWMPADEHDKLIQIANEREQSVSSLAREFLTRQVNASK